MYSLRLALGLLCLCSGFVAQAQELEPASGWRKREPQICPIPCVPETAPNAPNTSSPPNTAETQSAQPPSTNGFNEALASAGEGGTQPAASLMPSFFGDLLGGFGTKPVVTAKGVPRFAFAPIVSHAGAVKITDNESPRPVDRVFWFYNEFSYVNYSSNTDIDPINLQRHVFGFEKTFLDGWASVGMRLPVVNVDGPPELTTHEFADMTIVTKLMLWDDRRKNRLVSTGLCITVPTGQSEVFVSPASGNLFVLSDVLLQPWVGWIFGLGSRTFAHGFTSIVVPTDSKDVTVLFNDLGLGYWLWRNPDDGFIRGIVPTMEVHVNTPLNHRGKDGTLGFVDVVNLTWGLHLLLPRSTMGAAVGIPVSGPRPYGIEAVVRYEMKF